MQQESKSSNPRVIWQYWDSGLEAAPLVVRECFASWVSQNPDWEVRLLDHSSLSKFLAPEDLLERERYPSIQKYSNHIRLQLLRKYGGVWADADVYCHVPLDSWIHKAAPQGYFLFSKPAKHRPIANWMIISLDPARPDGALDILEAEYRAYFWLNRFRSGELPRRIADKLSSALAFVAPERSRVLSRFFLSRFAVKVLRLTPYFIFHYMYAHLLETNPAFAAQAKTAQNISAANCFAVRNLIRPDYVARPRVVRSDELWVSKLDHRFFTDETSARWQPLLRDPFSHGL